MNEIIITPELLNNHVIGAPVMKIFKGGITFNKAAEKLLALKVGSKFVLVMKGGKLHFKDVGESENAFKIASAIPKGGCRCIQAGFVNFLYPNDAKDKGSRKSYAFHIGENIEGLRLLTEIKL